MPLAFIMECSGGLAMDGYNRILDIEINTPHQRVPLALGSYYEVDLYCKFIMEH